MHAYLLSGCDGPRYPNYTVHDPESLFEESPKEVCAMHYQCIKRPFYLDACPRVMTDARIKALHEYDPTTGLVVFVRPQYEALLSMYNDRGSSGSHREGSDDWVLRNKYSPLFNYTSVCQRKVVGFFVSSDQFDGQMHNGITLPAAFGLP